MRKKGAWPIQKLGVLILALLAVSLIVYILFVREGGLGGIGEKVEKVKEYLPNESLLGPDEVEITPTIVPESHAIAIRSLRNAINKTLQVKKPNCFTEYGKLPDLGYQGTSIEFRYDNGKTTIIIYGGVDGRKIIPEFTTEFPEMIPCVIACTDEVAKNFFAKFIDQDKKELESGYFNAVDYVKLFYSKQTGHTACDKGNRIMTIAPTDETLHYEQGPNYYCNNLEDGGRFFSPDGRHICFMPTNYVTNADEHGMDNDYVSGDESNGIPKRLAAETLTLC